VVGYLFRFLSGMSLTKYLAEHYFQALGQWVDTAFTVPT